jgi:hypothetical protein
MRLPTRPTVLLHLALVALVTLTSLAGCADAPTAAASAAELRASSDAVRAGIERPWTGRCEVTHSITGFDVITGQPNTFLVTGTCQLAHLGRTTVVTEERGSAGGGFTGTSTYIAANGDRLYATVSGVSAGRPDGSLTNTGTVTVGGGTGRFAGASGKAAYFDVVHITSPTTAAGVYTLDGRLTY